MDRTNAPGHVNHLFVAEDPATNRPPTEITAQDMNAHQEELINIILAAQMAPDGANNAQVIAALNAMFAKINGATGLIRTLTPAGGARIRELGDIANAATVGGIEFGVSYNCNIDPATGVWAGRDVADICWLEKWTDAGGIKEFWYAPTAAAGAVPAWSKVFSLDMVGGGMYLAQEAGHVAFFARATAPAGYLKANGALVSRATYANLFASIGTTFGAGDGVTTFALPDLRGEFLRGFDDARGIDTGRTFGSWQKGSLIGYDTSQAGTVDGVWFASVLNNPTGSASQSAMGVDGYNTGDYANVALGGSTVSATSALPGPAGNQGFSGISRPRNIALLACIKY